MKKILASLMVLALCVPAMAATISIDVSTPLTAVITVDSSGDGVNMVGLGLNIDVDSGATVQTANVDTDNFNIYPDFANDEELNGDGYAYGEGHPVADQSDTPGPIDLPQSSFALSFGNLNGETVAGATGSDSVQITVTTDIACQITVCENAPRGGIVAVAGVALNADCVSENIAAGVTDCVNEANAPFYTEWVGEGKNWTKPDCWCFQRHCRGDSDDIKQGTARVSTFDLQALIDAYGKADFKMDQTKICADFDHIKQGTARVSTNDLAILIEYYGKADFKNPVCPADWDGVGGDDFNFWLDKDGNQIPL